MSHDHRPFGQQMADARRQRLKAQANEVSGTPSSKPKVSGPTKPGLEELRETANG